MGGGREREREGERERERERDRQTDRQTDVDRTLLDSKPLKSVLIEYEMLSRKV